MYVVDSAESVNGFKNRLDEYFNDHSVYDYDYKSVFDLFKEVDS